MRWSWLRLYHARGSKHLSCLGYVCPSIFLTSPACLPYSIFRTDRYLGPSTTSQSAPPKQHSPLARPPAKAPTPRQHPPPTMAKHPLPHRHPRPRNRARRYLLSTAAPTTAALEQHTTYLTTVPTDVHGGCGARCTTVPLAGARRDAVGGCER